MDEMKEFMLWLLNEFPDAFLRPPLSMFLGIVLLFFILRLIHNMLHI